MELLLILLGLGYGIIAIIVCVMFLMLYIFYSFGMSNKSILKRFIFIAKGFMVLMLLIIVFAFGDVLFFGVENLTSSVARKTGSSPSQLLMSIGPIILGWISMAVIFKGKNLSFADANASFLGKLKFALSYFIYAIPGLFIGAYIGLYWRDLIYWLDGILM